ncbi:MAG: hypothetical protein RBJ76_06555 [Stenomitos frigidus ULC029]
MLISSEDDSALLPLKPFQAAPDLPSGCQSRLEGNSAISLASTGTPVSKLIAGDRHERSVTRGAVLPSAQAYPLHQSSLLEDTSLLESELDGLYALRQVAKRRKLDQPQARAWSRVAVATMPKVTPDVLLNSYAAPLSPLRERDILALSALFQSDDIYTIEADVNHRLLSLLPEPCWDDDALTFLNEFL